MSEDVYVRYVPFPNYAARGMCVLNDDGSYSVYINSNLAWDTQLKALQHELRHIKNDDFHNGKPIWEIETNVCS